MMCRPQNLMYRPDVDPIGDVLALVRPEAMLGAELQAHGRWRLTFEGRPDDVKFGFVVQGECLLRVRRRTTSLRAGDVFLLAGPAAYVLASDLSAPARSGADLLHGPGVARLGSKREMPFAHVVGGRFVLDAFNAPLLVKALPEVVRIPAAEAVALRAVTQLLVDEVRAALPGRGRALDQLTQLLLTYAIRWLDRDATRTGWIRALADPRIGAALGAIHATVSAGTSLADLARVAGMSRTSFVVRFKELVGAPPLTYAIRWRMWLARDALRSTKRAIGELAFELGYESESAFSTAFRREIGCSPRAYRQAAPSSAGR